MNISSKNTRRIAFTALITGLMLFCAPALLFAQEQPAQPQDTRPEPGHVDIPDLPISIPRSSYKDYLPDFLTGMLGERLRDAKPYDQASRPSEELSILLDGRSGFVNIPHGPTLNMSPRSTIEVWIKTAEMGKTQGILEKYQADIGGFALRLTSEGVINFSATQQAPTLSNISIDGNKPLSPGEWHHIACVLDGKKLFLYVDGKLEIQQEGDVQPPSNSANLTIGLTHDTAGEKQYFNGLIDEVRISNFIQYTGSFQPEQYLFGGGIQGLTAGCWRFNDQSLADSTGNNNNGTLTGNLTFITDTPLAVGASDDETPGLSPASVIGFDDAPEGAVISNRYPEATFYDFNSGNLYANANCAQVNGQNQPCPGQIGKVAGAQPHDMHVVFRFAQPSTVTRFTILGNDHLFGERFAYLGFNNDGVSYSGIPIISNGRNSIGLGNPVYINLNQFTCGGAPCNKINTIVVYNISDYLGVVYDDFQFTAFANPTPTPNPCFPLSDNLDPCPPAPTPSPSPAPNPVNNVQAIRKAGEVEIRWNWPGSSPSNPNLPNGFKVYRSDVSSGPFVEVGDTSIERDWSFADISADQEIDNAKYYYVKAYNVGGISAQSAIVEGSPISPCDALPAASPQPPQVSFNLHNWSGTVISDAGSGWHEVRDVKLTGRTMARSMRMANFVVLQGQPTSVLTVVTLRFGKVTSLTPVKDTGQGLFSESTTCRSTTNGQHHWLVRSMFEFDKRKYPTGIFNGIFDVTHKCEPVGDVPCARFRPTVTYEYFSPKKFQRLDHHVQIIQRLHYRENDDPTNTIELFRDCDYPTILFTHHNGCSATEWPIATGGTKRIIAEEKAIAGVYDPLLLYDTRVHNDVPGDWDNMHQTGDEVLAGPAPFPGLRVAGCIACVHDHWRWTSNEPLPPPVPGYIALGTQSRIDKTYFRPGKNMIGQDYVDQRDPYYIPKQVGFLLHAKYKLGEEFLSTIPADEEVLYTPAEITDSNLTYKQAGGDIVTFYFVHGYEPAVERNEVFTYRDITHAHKAFFAEGVRNMEVPAGTTSGLTFFRPTKFVTETVFKAAPTIPASFGHGTSVPSLPAGYSYVGTGEMTIPVEVDYSRSLSSFGLMASGKQDITFKITDNSLGLTNLRVLYLAYKENGQILGWADITSGAIDTVNRTIMGKFDYYTKGGYLERNVRLFLIVRKTAPAVAVEPTADLAITGNSTPEPVRSGGNLTYNLTVTNGGPNPATLTLMKQYLPPETEFVSVTPSQGECVEPDDLHEGGSQTQIECNLGTIANSGTATVSLVVKVREFGDASPTGGQNHQLDSTAFTSSAEMDNNEANNSRVMFSTAQPSLNKPPAASITSPANEAKFVSPSGGPISIPITVNATDPDGTIASVEVVDNGNRIGTAVPIGGNNYTINLTAPSYGDHNIAAFAKDNGGRYAASKPVTFVVNSSSAITILTPAAGAMIAPNSTTRIDTRSTVPGGRVQKIEMFVDGSMIGEMRAASNTGGIYTHQINWTDIPRGRHNLRAVLTELSGATTTSDLVVVTAAVAPAISITSPADGDSFATVASLPINTSISSTNGYVAAIQYYASGVEIGSDLTAIASGARTLNWRNPPNGIYSIVAVATDDLGNTTTSNPVNIGINRPPPAIGEMLWVDDGLPQNATSAGDEGWNWRNINPGGLAGKYSHQSILKIGKHEHYFENASFKLQVYPGEQLSAWVYLDPAFPPAEIMLQWKEGASWEHRAYWGQNLITDVGSDGTNSRRKIGELPIGTGWKQLKIPASMVGLDNKLISGMKFTVYDGRVAWDRVGKLLADSPPPPQEQDFTWVDDAPPPGAALNAVHDTWSTGTWIGSNPTAYHGTLAHKHWDTDFNEPYREHSFKNSPVTMQVNPGDTLFTYVYLNPDAQYRPDTLLLQWYDETNTWVHRAYWGVDSRDIIASRIYLGGDAKVNTEGWRYMGPMPALNTWVRLEIPASYVGLEGKNVTGMAFGIYQKNKRGRAVWDYSGKTSSAPITTPLPLRYASPLWRYKCGTGSAMRYYYTPVKDHIFFDHPDCNTQTNTGFIYDYPAPGTIPLHSWHDANGVTTLDPCYSCINNIPGMIYRGIVANIFPAPSPPTPNPLPFTTVFKNYNCAGNALFTTHPAAPDDNAASISGCTFQFNTSAYVHTRDAPP